jgi:hypothetical protein
MARSGKRLDATQKPSPALPVLTEKPRGEELPWALKRFIIQRLACFDTPSQVAAAVLKDFGVSLTRQRVHYYDPTKKLGQGLAEDLRAQFFETRKAFLEDIDGIGIANKAVRLRRLDRMAQRAEDSRDWTTAAALMEQAAKEMGGAFTNKHQHELTGRDGGPIRTVAEIVPGDLAKYSDEQLTQLYREAAQSAERAGRPPDPTKH